MYVDLPQHVDGVCMHVRACVGACGCQGRNSQSGPDTFWQESLHVDVHVVACMCMWVQCMCMWMHVCACGCMYVHVGACMCMWMHVCACACGCMYVHVGACMCMWMCMWVHVCAWKAITRPAYTSPSSSAPGSTLCCRRTTHTSPPEPWAARSAAVGQPTPPHLSPEQHELQVVIIDLWEVAALADLHIESCGGGWGWGWGWGGIEVSFTRKKYERHALVEHQDLCSVRGDKPFTITTSQFHIQRCNVVEWGGAMTIRTSKLNYKTRAQCSQCDKRQGLSVHSVIQFKGSGFTV